MDTEQNNCTDKHEQGAVVAAVLSKDPSWEAESSRPTAASPKEKSQAAYVGVMRGQTRRLSGAQQRRLNREKKMRDGTWTVKKPSRGISSSKQEGAAGSSWGVKRTYSDLSVPSTEQISKKCRSTAEYTGSYKDDDVSIRMAVIHKNYPAYKLTEEQGNLIKEKLLAALDANSLEETPPQFLESRFSEGIMWIVCANESSKVWLVQTVGRLRDLWDGADLIVVDPDPRRTRVVVHIPDIEEMQKVISRLRIQNPDLKTEDWYVQSRQVLKKGQVVVFSIDPGSYRILSKNNLKAFWGLGRITFVTMPDEGPAVQEPRLPMM